MNNQLHGCSYCGNEYTIEEGYNLETKQCPPCDEWDKNEPTIRKQWEEDRIQQEKFENINFPYVPGDPFW